MPRPARFRQEGQPANLTGWCRNYLAVDDEDAPLGLVLEDAAPPLIPPVVLDDVPPVPLVELLPVPVVELLAPGLVVVLDDEELGELGTTVVEDEDEPPGTTTVSLVVELVDELAGGAELPPGGITVVVSFFSQADNANAPTKTNR